MFYLHVYSAISALLSISTLPFVHLPTSKEATSLSPKKNKFRNVAENSFTSTALPETIVAMKFTQQRTPRIGTAVTILKGWPTLSG